MTKIGIVPFDGNPSTSRLIIPSHLQSHDNTSKIVQLGLQFNDCPKSKKDLYCNGCENFICIKRPDKNKFNTRCSADTMRPGGSYRVIKLNVFPEEKVKKPFWCPIIKSEIVNLNKNVKETPNNSDKMEKEKWLAIKGITAWNDIKLGKIYHLPPTIKRNRMDLAVKSISMNSMYCEDIKTGNNVWLYKADEEYKFMFPIE